MTTLMVHMQLGRSNGKLLRITSGLADSLAADIIGIAACRPPAIPSEDYFTRVSKHGEWELEREISDAEREFKTAFKNQNEKIEWRSRAISAALADYLAEQARSADLVIAAIDRDIPVDASRSADIGDLVMQIGRPVLVVPPSDAEADIGRVLVSWKNTREARRAILDALPLLKTADYVAVCEVAPEDGLAQARASLSDVIAWLSRHHVAAEACSVLAMEDDVRNLSAVATDQATGVIVAGAFGHGKLREAVLGGVTKKLLERSERCLFLSH